MACYYVEGNVESINLGSSVESKGAYLLEIIKPDNSKLTEKVILH
jgi:hypothetical protein